MKTTPNIKGRSGASTGITEDLATKLYAKKGTRVLAIVEFQSDKTHEGLDGNRQVDLTIETIEPVVDGDLNGQLDEHVRTIQAALFRNRKLSEGDDEALPFGEEDGPAPAVADIIQQGQPFVADEDELAAQEAEEEREDEPVPS